MSLPASALSPPPAPIASKRTFLFQRQTAPASALSRCEPHRHRALPLVSLRQPPRARLAPSRRFAVCRQEQDLDQTASSLPQCRIPSTATLPPGLLSSRSLPTSFRCPAPLLARRTTASHEIGCGRARVARPLTAFLWVATRPISPSILNRINDLRLLTRGFL